jgi:hypothetical protein
MAMASNTWFCLQAIFRDGIRIPTPLSWRPSFMIRCGYPDGGRLRQDSVDDRENGCICADTEAKGDHRDCREADVPAHHAEPVAQIRGQSLQRGGASLGGFVHEIVREQQ